MSLTQRPRQRPTPVVVVPVNGVAPTLVPVTVNAGPGDQYDPHVSGDWMAYTSDHTIRCYNFVCSVVLEALSGSLERGGNLDFLEATSPRRHNQKRGG